MSSFNNSESYPLVTQIGWEGIVERYIKVPGFNCNEPIYATQYQPAIPNYDAYVGFLEKSLLLPKSIVDGFQINKDKLDQFEIDFKSREQKVVTQSCTFENVINFWKGLDLTKKQWFASNLLDFNSKKDFMSVFFELCTICDVKYNEDKHSHDKFLLDQLYIQASTLWSIANQELMVNSSNRINFKFPIELSREDVIALEEFFTLCRIGTFVKQSK